MMNGMSCGLYQGTAFSRAEKFATPVGFSPCFSAAKEAV